MERKRFRADWLHFVLNLQRRGILGGFRHLDVSDVFTKAKDGSFTPGTFSFRPTGGSMTPSARIAAAIEILDAVLTGAPAERVLTNWARSNRFAGSGDRSAIRDHVYDALRRRRSHAVLGGSLTGRGLMLGALREAGAEPEAVFTGIGHAPAALSPSDTPGSMTEDDARDLPDWLISAFRQSLGASAEDVARALRDRAPVFLRVNVAKTGRDQAIATLADEGILTRPHPLAATSLEVVDGARKVQQSKAFLSGLVELQDAASQAVVEALPLRPNGRVLDYCAGGGGKTLAIAAQGVSSVYAHDAKPARMRDLVERAKRAGAKVMLVDQPGALPAFDLVLADAPCSGSGSWRRDPQGKWALTPERLAEICAIQSAILDRIAPLVAVDGCLAYATCSMLEEENSLQIQNFMARSSGWSLIDERRFTPLSGGDGFYLALLRRVT